MTAFSGSCGSDLHVDRAVEALERAGVAELLPAGVGRRPLDLDADHARVGRRRRQGEQQAAQNHECECSSDHDAPP